SPRCWAVSSSDTAPVLWSLGARVRLHSPTGERTIPVEALFRDDGIEYLAKRPDEILTEILLPPAEGWRSAYLKLRRRGSFDFPVLGVAVAVRMEGDVVRDARIVVGAVASQPRPAPAAAAALVGGRLTPELIARVSGLAAGPAKPLDNTDFTHPYRKKMTRVFVARALASLAGLAPAGWPAEEVALPRSASASRACAPSASCSSGSSRRRRTSRRAWCPRSSRGGSRRRSTRWAGSRRRSACRSARSSTASPPARSW